MSPKEVDVAGHAACSETGEKKPALKDEILAA
jgi:hypothetical protein